MVLGCFCFMAIVVLFLLIAGILLLVYGNKLQYEDQSGKGTFYTVLGYISIVLFGLSVVLIMFLILL